MTQSDTLEDRVALVTGGGRGIGRAIAEHLAAQGARVVIADSGTGIDGKGADPTVAEQAAAAIGGQAAAFTQSIASPSTAAAAVAHAVERFGGLDIVVNNAAIMRDAFIFKGDPGDWEAVIRNNLSAAYFVLCAATPQLRAQAKAGRGGEPYGWGRIVNIVSTAGLYGNFGQSPYASSKAGLVGLTRVVALDLQRAGITCNAIAPFAATRVTDTIVPANDAQAAYKERALKVEPRHVARLAGQLCATQAQDISGQLFGVRGREVFLFSQPRPVARLVAEEGGDLAAAMAEAFGGKYIELSTDLEAFSSEPII